ncbi:MAG: VanZ family protein [candidate division WOR-3 bacterium]|nr:VanZ family protein [candidate division WOR-3 bacterium]
MLVVTLMPISDRWQQSKGWDKFVHFSVFGILGFFAQASISLWSLLYTSVLAGLTEIMQKFIPNRVPDITDFSFNLIGMVIGSSLWELVRKRKG